MDKKDFSSLETHRRPQSSSKRETIYPPQKETGLVGYYKKQDNDRPFINEAFSPEKQGIAYKQYKTTKKHGKKIHIHQNDSLSIKDQDLRSPKSFPTSLEASNSNNNNNDDDVFGVIDMSKITPSPMRKRRQLNIGVIDGLLEISDDEEDETKKTKKQKQKQNVFSTELEPLNLLNAFEESKYGTRDMVLEKYKSKHIPASVQSRKTLLDRARAHFEVLGPILRGKSPPSMYYEEAKKLQKKSAHETMTAKEQMKINWESFYGGYYGFQRQSIIGKEITKVCKKELHKNKKNPTISYWSIPSFATHVLANEVIIRLIMEDMKLDFEQAENFCKDTVDYGIVIADKVEIDDDV
ncbi:RTC4 [Candida margitis]|uniref:RTC4 n=1 Tax=Candida margitis TaxID=1775924 RepID=UPI0022263102|nr:RTC4 [Candida margitis]KAI5967942.1 RTC4 [Candida margitis]